MSGRAGMKRLFFEKAFHTRSPFSLMLVCMTQSVTVLHDEFWLSADTDLTRCRLWRHSSRQGNHS
jgi:hypothetical protein